MKYLRVTHIMLFQGIAACGGGKSVGSIFANYNNWQSVTCRSCLKKALSYNISKILKNSNQTLTGSEK